MRILIFEKIRKLANLIFPYIENALKWREGEEETRGESGGMRGQERQERENEKKRTKSKRKIKKKEKMIGARRTQKALN